MSLHDRRRFLLTLTAVSGLAACGFSPIYTPGGGGARLRGAVRVDAPTDSDSFDLVKELEARLGRPDAPRYTLSVKLMLREESLAITGGNDITRYNLVGRATFSLREIAAGKPRASGRVDAFSAYSATTSTVATLAAKRDAHARLMRMLADQIVTRLLAAAHNPAQ